MDFRKWNGRKWSWGNVNGNSEKRMRGNWRLPIYVKIVLSFLIVVTPISALSLQMNEGGRSVVERELSNSMQTNVSFYLMLLQSELERLVNMQRQYVNDQDLLKLSIEGDRLSDYDRMVVVSSLHRKLELLKQSSVYLDNVSAHIPLLARTVSSANFYTPLAEEEYAALRELSYGAQPLIYSWGERLFLSVPYPEPPLSDSRQPLFLLTAELSAGTIRSMLREIGLSGFTGAMLVGNGWTIQAEPEEDRFAALAAARLKQQLDAGITAGMFTSSELEAEPLLVTFRHSPSLDTALLVHMPVQQALGPLISYEKWFYWLALLSLLVIIMFSYWIFRLIHRPLHEMVRAFRLLEQGNLEVRVEHSTNDEFGYLFRQFNHMVGRLKSLIQEAYLQKINAQQSELKQLQAQINPHFLYNSFFILEEMADDGDTERLKQFTNHLGDYFQFITRSHQTEVKLEAEVRHARAYAEIQSVRFGSRIALEFADLPAQLPSITVPRLILQPLIENAYKHGLENKLSEGLVRVSFHCEPEQRLLLIVVEDNGKGMAGEELEFVQRQLLDPSTLEEVTGLVNIDRRVRMFFGAPCGLSVSLNEWGGVRSKLHIVWKGEEGDAPAAGRR